MSYPDIDEPECDECGSYHCKLICEDCAKEKYENQKSPSNKEEGKWEI